MKGHLIHKIGSITIDTNIITHTIQIITTTGLITETKYHPSIKVSNYSNILKSLINTALKH